MRDFKDSMGRDVRKVGKSDDLGVKKYTRGKIGKNMSAKKKILPKEHWHNLTHFHDVYPIPDGLKSPETVLGYYWANQFTFVGGSNNGVLDT